ncbi:extracellular solute-binding protein [Streptomyces sp. NPDC005921]
MDLSRRGFLQAAALTAAASGLTVACGGSGSGGTKNGKNLTLWYWGGALSEKVVAEAKTHFSGSVKLTAASIGGDFKQKLTTTLAAGGSSVPDITGIKGEDIASFLPNASRFLDLNDLGFKKLSSQYLGWKTKLAQTSDGKQIGFPIDIGPTALFYREDLFAKAGVATDPDKVAALVTTWEDYFQLGLEVQKKNPGTYLVNNLGSMFDMTIGQGSLEGFDEDDSANALRGVFSWSYRTLGAEAKRVFRQLPRHRAPDISTDALASAAGISRDAAATAARELLRARLLDARGRDRYSAHDLVLAYAAELDRAGKADRSAAARRSYVHSRRSAGPAARPLSDRADTHLEEWAL